MSRFPCGLAAGLFALGLAAPAAELDSEIRAALAHIRPDSLRGHLSFLASDLLEGRASPSRGLDIAAEYIAAQFRRAGLEPLGDDGYFQTARYVSLQPNTNGLRFEITGEAALPAASLTLDSASAISLDAAACVKYGPDVEAGSKVVFLYARGFRELAVARRKLASSGAALLVVTGPSAGSNQRTRTRMIAAGEAGKDVPVLSIKDETLASRIDTAAAGPLPFTATVHAAAPAIQDVRLRNVIGVLRGSDPVLRDSYELVTAHYDHLGMKPAGDGDRVFNGANDDGSGTVSVIEIASALASMAHAPRRSVVFMAFFGEESGLLGSRFYGSHPAVPLARTVADVNLEQIGRTDSSLGAHVGMVNFTGFDFSEVTSVFKQAGELTGIRVEKDEQSSDPFFSRSDNQALADMGVPAHTISVAYEFPDYHQVGDEWQKIDYENMAKVDRMIALGLIMIGNSAIPPRWNDSDPKTAPYLEAWKKLHANE